jgi:hypothetical protein
VADIGFPDDLIALERAAWAAIQAGTLTVDQASAVQDRITAWTAETGLDRHTVEMGLKRAVRHPEG